MAGRSAPPRAAALVESLRGLGYSTSTAVADIVDNSIAAGAETVDIRFHWVGDASWISILDDGRGMSAKELDSAMRLGDRNPLDERTPGDLGRFGLGLKTASFSQARSLTVASRSEGVAVECLRWDLDELAASADDGWYLLEGPRGGSDGLLSPLEGMSSGTLVLLEKLDRLVTPGFGSDDFLEVIDRVEQHLAMTFHRYLEGSRPRLRLLLNGSQVSPWDPFMTDHPSKPWCRPEIELATGRVRVQCHVLPHRDKLSAQEQARAAGPDGWNSAQGFYVYRNERLIVAGSWLGLGSGRHWTKDEAHRLARIRLDITNDADTDWKLDIRKSTARPPVWLRKPLTRLAEETRTRARQVFAHRGSPSATTRAGPVAMAWQAVRTSGATRYAIARDHEAVRSLMAAAPQLAGHIELVLRVIEETVPVQRIWLDTAEDRDTPLTGFAGEPDDAIVGVLRSMYRVLVAKNGLSSAEARARLTRTEPFDQYPALVAALGQATPADGV